MNHTHLTNLSFDVCYKIPGFTTWESMSNLDLPSVIYIETKLRDLRRNYRIRDAATGQIWCPFLLYLFSIPLSGRKPNLPVSRDRR